MKSTSTAAAPRLLDDAVEGCVDDLTAALARLYRRAGVVVPLEHVRGLAAALEPLLRELATRGRACMDAANRDVAPLAAERKQGHAVPTWNRVTSETRTLH